MRYVIFGAGAVGGVIGGRLAAAGVETAVVARGKHLDALRQRGLRVVDPDREIGPDVEVCATIAEAAPRPGDVVILTMKTQHTEGALADLAAVAPGTTVVCAQNGLENERLALRRFADVHGMCVVLPASIVEPGVVQTEAAPVSGVLDLGRYPSGVTPVDERIASDLRNASFASAPDGDVMRWKRTKLLSNVGNALEAALGTAAWRSPLRERARAEAMACYEVAGLTWVGTEEEAERRTTLSKLRPVEGRRREGGSSWQSLARGAGNIEADWLNGEIVLLGRIHNVPTPVNAMLQSLANEMARTGAPPGSMTEAQLEARIGDEGAGP